MSREELFDISLPNQPREWGSDLGMGVRPSLRETACVQITAVVVWSSSRAWASTQFINGLRAAEGRRSGPTWLAPVATVDFGGESPP